MAHSGQPLSTGNESSAAALPVSTHEPAGAPHTPLDERTPLPQSSQPVPQRLPLTTRAWKACRATVGKADNPKCAVPLIHLNCSC
ncbi:hypothetical protein BDN71DRAFT_1450462 [Pleurotus eryngii]|uniref:Uncharacterized protein n=1 Tax=Pleurotus eryngii TaxID=5323 RepID=A0A9P5ZT76_PLEER|nr:hypothetical protein BDN71DRAFT_1450462 [Pleurotus eryngii]